MATANSLPAKMAGGVKRKYTGIDLSSDGFSFYSKLIFLYLLNLADWICTEALILSGFFVEANPIMKPVFGDFWLTVSVKGVLPLVLIEICAIIYRMSGRYAPKSVDVMLKAGIAIYTLINLWHIFNFVLLFLNF